MENNNDIPGKVYFHGYEIYMSFPESFDDFQNELGGILGIRGDFISNFTLTYYKGGEEEFEIENGIDYQKFYNYASEENYLVVLNVKMNEVSSIDIKKCISNALKYIAKYSKEQQQDNLKNDLNNEKSNQNIINENESNFNQKNKNIIFNNNLIDEDDNKNNNNSQTSINLMMMAFPISCNICTNGPILQLMYICPHCKLVFCFHCEIEKGPTHKHAYYKVQTKEQFFECIKLGLIKYVPGFKNKKKKNFDNIVNNNSKGNNGKIDLMTIKEPQLVSLVDVTRNLYDLSNVSDQKIADALTKTKGNIDEALLLLISDEK